MFKYKVLFFILSFLFLLSFNDGHSFVAILRIPGIDLYTKVYQYTDNKYYLEHDEYGNADKHGSVFLDYRNNLTDKKLLIFGHNSRSYNTKFKKLERYLLSDFFEEIENRYLYLEFDRMVFTYLIKSVLIVDNSSLHMYLKYNEEEWVNHIKWINSNSIYKSDINNDSDILILQTCLFDNPNGKYLLVVAEKFT